VIFKWDKNPLVQLYYISIIKTFEHLPNNEDDDQYTGFNRNVVNMEEDY
jgi:hypothetical protein